MFETFSFLPPLTDAEISRQVDYIVNNGWSECCHRHAARKRAPCPCARGLNSRGQQQPARWSPPGTAGETAC